MKCNDCDYGYAADDSTCKHCQGFGELPPRNKCLICQRHASKCACKAGVLKMSDADFGNWLQQVEAEFLAEVEGLQRLDEALQALDERGIECYAATL